MMMLLLMTGIGALLGGLVAIVYGIPVKEFSFGNTLIVVGAMTACTGLIMIALSVVVGELKMIARRLASGGAIESRARAALGSAGSAAADDDFEFSRDSSSTPPETEDLEAAPPPLNAPLWNGKGASRARKDVPPAPEPAEPAPQAPPKPRRNLLFASSSRKERERSQARPADVPFSAPPPLAESEPPPNFDEPWPKPERLRLPELPSQRRGGRTPPSLNEPNAGSARSADQQTVTVLKSGVVDGMAYSLFSDGSIEAQLPEGTMRFGSIDELRAHLDQRPG